MTCMTIWLQLLSALPLPSPTWSLTLQPQRKACSSFELPSCFSVFELPSCLSVFIYNVSSALAILPLLHLYLTNSCYPLRLRLWATSFGKAFSTSCSPQPSNSDKVSNTALCSHGSLFIVWMSQSTYPFMCLYSQLDCEVFEAWDCHISLCTSLPSSGKKEVLTKCF